MATETEKILSLGGPVDNSWKTGLVKQAQMSTQQLGQFCFFGIGKIETALTEILYDEGVEPEKRVKIKKMMHRRLEDIAQDMIVEAINGKMLSESRLRESKKRKKRTVIFDNREDI
jgi:formamidopyrimidine-DNA glycosylase